MPRTSRVEAEKEAGAQHLSASGRVLASDIAQRIALGSFVSQPATQLKFPDCTITAATRTTRHDRAYRSW
eukprot:2532647-Rhodomonas_salina.1